MRPFFHLAAPRRPIAASPVAASIAMPAVVALTVAMAIAPLRAVIAQDMTYPKVQSQAAAAAVTQTLLPPIKAEGSYFFAATDGGVYIRHGRTGPRQLLFQPKTVAVFAPSPDGRYVAYGLLGPGASGDRPSEVRIRDVNRNRDIGEVLHNADISIAPWTRNGKGFFYIRQDTAEHRQRVYYHLLGDPPARDRVILSRPEYPDWTYSVRVSDDGRFAIMNITHPGDANNRLYFIDLDNPQDPELNAPAVKLVDSFGARYEFVDNAGSSFFLLTNRDAPRQRIVLANTDDTRESRWKPVISESADSLIAAHTAGDEYLITVSRTGDKTVARVYQPPTKKEMQAEFRKRLDSLQKEGGRHPQPPSGGMNGMDRPRRTGSDFPALRLNLKREIPLPARSTLLAMNSNVEQDELFYIVQLTDGTAQTYVYNVKRGTNEPFDTRPESSAGSR